MNIWKKLGYKKIVVKGNVFLIKKLEQIDFIDKEGVPFNLFDINKSDLAWDKANKELETEAEKKLKQENIKKNIKAVLEVGIVRMPDKLMAVDDLIQDRTIELGYEVYVKILEFCLKKLRKIYLVNHRLLGYYAAMSNTYKKFPIDCLFPKGGYSDVEAFIFNSFVLNYQIEKEHKEAKKLTAGVAKK